MHVAVQKHVDDVTITSMGASVYSLILSTATMYVSSSHVARIVIIRFMLT